MADVDANVKCQLSKLEVKRGRLEIAISPGLHVEKVSGIIISY